jgi:sigma-B regulation protein RsbU (phosphoserine phosphatase)
MKQIFISYSNKDKALVDHIEYDFKKIDLTLIRDIRDVQYRESFKDFMGRINETDYVLMLVSDNFLKSDNCMYEVLEVIKNREFKTKLLPIRTEELDVFSFQGKTKYIRYWEEKLHNIEEELKSLSTQHTSGLIGTLKQTKNICLNINDFLEYLYDTNIYSFNHIVKNKYKDVLNVIFKEDIIVNELIKKIRTETKLVKANNYEDLLIVKQLQINSLLEVSRAINNNFSISALFRIYEFILRAQMGINGLLVYVKSSNWECECFAGIDPELKNKINVERDLILYKSITILRNLTNKNLNQFDILIPVFHKDTVLAYVLIGGLRADDTYTIEEKLKFVQTITNIVMVAVENKRVLNYQIQQDYKRRDVEIAAQMQAMLIPVDLPDDEKIEVASVYLPHYEIGGDYYDLLKFSNTDIAFIIGDISGKGISAALLMANFQGYLRSQMLETNDLKILIESLNDRVCNITKGDKFITLFLGVFNYETRVLRYVNAGHNPPILYNQNTFSELETGCTLLGMFEDLPFINVGEVLLDKDAVLINYTDGLIDIENDKGEFFSLENLKTFFKANHNLPIKEINKKLMDYVYDFKGKVDYNDDITVLSCRFH